MQKPVGNVVEAAYHIDFIVHHRLPLRVPFTEASGNGAELSCLWVPDLKVEVLGNN